jgi:hypothetical protein
VTEALPFIVNVQLLVLLPPLEHAPDQMASRPLLTLRVIEVPVANEAEPVLPTGTLMPAGLDVIRSPLRPVAVTVSVACCDGGVTVSVAVRVTPAALAVIVTGVDVVTALVEIANVALVAPCATDTLAGTVAAVLLLESDTPNPPAGAAAVSVTVPCAPLPPTTLVGLTDTAESAAGAVAACGVKRRTVENGPAVPAELIPRTRHQCWRAARTGAVNCDAVTVRSTTSGAENVSESSIWIR